VEDLEIHPGDLRQRLDRGERILLIDVREPWEHALCRLPGAKLIPLGSLASNVAALPDAGPVICYCHHGMRSLDAAAWLRGQGIAGAKSLAGGIDRWSLEMDPSIARY